MPDLAYTCDCALRPALQRPLYADTLSSDPPSDAHRGPHWFLDGAPALAHALECGLWVFLLPALALVNACSALRRSACAQEAHSTGPALPTSSFLVRLGHRSRHTATISRIDHASHCNCDAPS